MTLSTTQVTQITDSVAKTLSDAYTNITGPSNVLATPVAAIATEFGGLGATNTLGRINAIASVPDLASELALLPTFNVAATQLVALLTGYSSQNAIYQSIFPALNALDTLVGGINAYLTANSLQVNAFYALAHNYFATLATSMSLRGSAPIQIAAANIFPYAALDSTTALANVTTGTGTVLSAATYPAASSAAGGGIAPLYIYKVNSGNAAGGATFTITYINASGVAVTTTYSTTTGVPVGSGSLAAGYALGVSGSAVTQVTVTGATSGEQYIIGAKLVRTPQS